MMEGIMKKPLMDQDRAHRFLEKQISSRFWMFVLLSLSSGAGYAANRVSLLFGFSHPGFRYGFAILISYGTLIAGVRVWLGWVVDWLHAHESQKGLESSETSPHSSFQGQSTSQGWTRDMADELSAGMGDATLEISSQDVRFLGRALKGLGKMLGDLGNGIGDFFGSLFGDEGAIPVILIAVLLLCILAAVGGWAYLIVIAPELLTEVALQFLISSAVLPGLRPAMGYARGTQPEMDHAPWIKALVRKTSIPFGIILALSVGLGFTLDTLAPGARTLREAIEILNAPSPTPPQ
jgi:hypothetical protein